MATKKLADNIIDAMELNDEMSKLVYDSYKKYENRTKWMKIAEAPIAYAADMDKRISRLEEKVSWLERRNGTDLDIPLPEDSGGGYVYRD